MDQFLVEVVAKSGLVGVVLFLAWRVIDKAFDRLVATIEKLGASTEKVSSNLILLNERIAQIETQMREQTWSRAGVTPLRAKDR